MLRSPHGNNPLNANFPIVLNSPLYHATTNAANLENEIRFFRTLVEQNGREKEVMISTIESLQAENQSAFSPFPSLPLPSLHHPILTTTSTI